MTKRRQWSLTNVEDRDLECLPSPRRLLPSTIVRLAVGLYGKILMLQPSDLYCASSIEAFIYIYI